MHHLPRALGCLVVCVLSFAAHAKPNILIILSDDQGWGDLSATGNSNLSTPNIDSLAKTGVTLDRFYVCPVCSPTRAEFLTGRYHPRGGVRDVSTGGERLNPGERTIAQVFKAAGYATGAFGKWHNGSQAPYHPSARGFDEYYGFTSGHWGDYFDPPLEHNGKAVRGKGFIIDDLTDHAMAFMEANRSRPFFCYVPYCTPHSPMQVPDRFWAKFAQAELKLTGGSGEDLNHTRAALAMCENIDFNVGRLLAKLDELNLARDTIVIYFSDNGPNGARWNGGMKGRKGSTDEGGVRSPFFIRWPAGLPTARNVPQIAGAIDLLPTLADLAGVPVGPGPALDGLSLRPLLTGTAPNWPDRMIFSHWAGKVSVRTQQYRLDMAGKLFDMPADPAQAKDVSRQRPADAARLQKAVEQWRTDVLAGMTKKDDRPFSVGSPELAFTPLPARDGRAQGGIRRSANAPNCSYFTNWAKPEDAITWDIDVKTAGRYQAVVHYTCPVADVGSAVELSFNGSAVAGKVTEAHDPPARGAEHDRVPRRGESLVKDFRPMILGEIELKPGRGALTLKATRIPGRSVMEVRRLDLTLVR